MKVFLDTNIFLEYFERRQQCIMGTDPMIYGEISTLEI